MAENTDHTLYEDEYYVVLRNDDRQNITLIMPKRRVALEFTYQEWADLRSIVSCISTVDVPETKKYEKVVLHEDKIHLFYGHEDYIEWAIEDRMVSVGWHHQGWERFKAMMAAVGHVPWNII